MTKSKLICFSPGGEKLAHSGPDGVLRIWDTTSGVLEHEYQPAEHLKATTSCIKYSPTKTESKAGHSLLAMGTLAGTILIYSPEESEVKATLEHSSHQAIMDVAWFSSDRLVSLARDNTIVNWDVETGKKDILDEVCDGTTICLFGKKTLVVGNRKIQVLLQQNSGKIKVKHNFTGHTSIITQMLPVRTKEKTDYKYFLSSSLDDRFIYAWSTGNTSEAPICSFMVKDTVTNMAAGELNSNTLALSATTHKGALVLFTHHLNGNTSGKAIKHTGSLQIYSMSESKKTIIPIVASYFCGDLASSIIIVYNRSSIFTFERMSIDKIVGNQELIRAEPSASKGLSLLKTLTPSITEDATMVGPMHSPVSKNIKSKRKRGDEDNVASLPMEERLNVLALDTSGSQGAGRQSGKDDFAQLLLQGLHSKDQNILKSVFDRGDIKAINKTVRRLPVQAVVPLIEQLSLAIMGKGHKNANHVKWVRAVLYHHMSHLTTVPDRQKLMEPFVNISAARMSTFSQVTQLHARLDLMLTHVTERQQEVKQNDAEPEALLVYKDESSDEDDMMDNIMGVSESEDNWDELSGIEDEVNGPTDEESDMEVDQRLGAVKRKLKGTEEPVNGEQDEEEMDDNEEEDSEEEEESEDEEEEEEEDDISEADMNGGDHGGTDSDSGE